MNLPQTLREYLLKKSAEEEEKQRLSLLLKKRLNYLKELTEEIDEGVFEKYTGDNPFP